MIKSDFFSNKPTKRKEPKHYASALFFSISCNYSFSASRSATKIRPQYSQMIIFLP